MDALDDGEGLLLRSGARGPWRDRQPPLGLQRLPANRGHTSLPDRAKTCQRRSQGRGVHTHAHPPGKPMGHAIELSAPPTPLPHQKISQSAARASRKSHQIQRLDFRYRGHIGRRRWVPTTVESDPKLK